MPDVKKGESEKDYVARCIPIMKAENSGRKDDQIAAICYSKFEQAHKKKAVKESLGFKDLTEEEVFYTDKDLEPEEARKRTIGKVKKDHRGFRYEAKTGKCTYI